MMRPVSLALMSVLKRRYLSLSLALSLLMVSGCQTPSPVMTTLTCPTLPELPPSLATPPQANHLLQATLFIKHNRAQ